MVKKACIEGNNNFGLREISITKCFSFLFWVSLEISS
jgi:hypothetical protein